MPAARTSAVPRSENPSRASKPSRGDQSSVAVASDGFAGQEAGQRIGVLGAEGLEHQDRVPKRFGT